MAAMLNHDSACQAAELYLAAVRTMGRLANAFDGTVVIQTAGMVGGVAVTMAAAYPAIHRDGPCVCLCRIKAHEPGHGDGSRVMLRLCGLADLHGVRLELVACPLTPIEASLATAERLVNWYKRFGFVGSAFGMHRTPLAVQPRTNGSDDYDQSW